MWGYTSICFQSSFSQCNEHRESNMNIKKDEGDWDKSTEIVPIHLCSRICLHSISTFSLSPFTIKWFKLGLNYTHLHFHNNPFNTVATPLTEEKETQQSSALSPKSSYFTMNSHVWLNTFTKKIICCILYRIDKLFQKGREMLPQGSRKPNSGYKIMMILQWRHLTTVVLMLSGINLYIYIYIDEPHRQFNDRQVYCMPFSPTTYQYWI